MFKKIIQANLKLWKKDVWDAWDTLPLNKKLIWFLVINHTIAIITILEIFILKK